MCQVNWQLSVNLGVSFKSKKLSDIAAVLGRSRTNSRRQCDCRCPRGWCRSIRQKKTCHRAQGADFESIAEHVPRLVALAAFKTIDTLIATSCIEKGLALLYSDKDFDPFVEHLELQSAMSET